MACPLNKNYDSCELIKSGNSTYVKLSGTGNNSFSTESIKKVDNSSEKKIVTPQVSSSRSYIRVNNIGKSTNPDKNKSDVQKQHVGNLPQLIPQAVKTTNVNTTTNSNRIKVEAARKTPGGTFLTLISYLKLLQSRGIDYVYVNQYLLAEFKALGDDNPMGVGYIAEMLTYDPRNDPAKDYVDVLNVLKTAPQSMDWTQIWDIIDGLKTF